MKLTFVRCIVGALGIFLLLSMDLSAQSFTLADTLRGMLRPERTCYDVTFYNLEVKVDPDKKSIAGFNEIHFTAQTDFNRLQIDLFPEMLIDKILWGDEELSYERKFDAVFVTFPSTIKAGKKDHFTVYYHGTPISAKMPPWDGGFVWKKDKNQKPWIGVACEGIGASLWWPLKDHLSDEPDSMAITSIVPSDLVSVSNGRLRKKENRKKGWTAWTWVVSYPINSYNVTLNIADYAHIHDTYSNAEGNYDLDYYILAQNEEKAGPHFEQVKPMLEVFEEAFGEYPFWRDGYKLVETSYWGMEHQGAIAYGNNYKNNSYGWDYIIVHESGHEWWGNSISCPDHAELWIHESFCTYAEAVYMEKRFGYEKMIEYMRSHRLKIANASPIVGKKDVNFQAWKDSDMYYKGAWLLHTLRGVVNDDALWWKTLKGFHEDHRISIVSTDQTIAYFNEKLGKDYSYFWDQYLNFSKPPVFTYALKEIGENRIEVRMRWDAQAEGFKMPLWIKTGEDSYEMIHPTQEWQTIELSGSEKTFRVDMNRAYVNVKALKE